ncbi:predicted glycosyltransferase [Lentisphaera araneosa HTCC2155]|uniref:Predicted glycosyltransferase n=1 Tax=Lentisphaera araneosa HTCC2155 TaxID=313628 RepID=A6DT07_9BACT|nr:glycosyltransferase [Lentisphaera araneosa]EDM25182.1 predicted glycosyltransferase [Lentisphaera araneosa HTCC2155]
MRVIQLTTELLLAGAERVILELSRELVRLGHEVLVISLAPIPQDRNQTIVDDLEQAGVKYESLNLSKKNPFGVFKLRRLLKEFKTDVVHAHMIHSNLLSRLLVPTKIQLINTVHIAERRSNKGWHFLWDRLTFSEHVTQTCVSKAVADFHAKKIGVESLPVVYNGLTCPPKLSSQTLKSLRKEWGLDHCNKIMGSVGRLNQQKGYDWFLKELKGVTVPPEEKWGLVILGEGEERTQLEALVKELPDNIKCVLPGFRSDAASCIGAFDCFVMPSNYEGFGLTLIEAMSHGVPIVANAVDSLPELMEYYDNGVCSTKINFIAQVQQAIQKSKVQGTFPFTVQKMADEYLALYEGQ